MHTLLAVSRGLEEPGSGFGEGAEAAGGFAVRFVGRRAALDELLGAQRQVEFDLVFDFAFPPVAAAKRQTKSATNAGANHVPAVDGVPLFDAVRMLVTVSAYWTQLRVSARRWARPAAVSL
jgi:hypothetical protein